LASCPFLKMTEDCLSFLGSLKQSSCFEAGRVPDRQECNAMRHMGMCKRRSTNRASPRSEHHGGAARHIDIHLGEDAHWWRPFEQTRPRVTSERLHVAMGCRRVGDLELHPYRPDPSRSGVAAEALTVSFHLPGSRSWLEPAAAQRSRFTLDPKWFEPRGRGRCSRKRTTNSLPR
jgi:hypothetical protein